MDITKSIQNIRLLDDLSRNDTFVHRLHPLVKLLTTVAYLVVVISFGKYEVGSMLPFVFYPILIFAFAELPVLPVLKRLWIVAPFIIGIGILNPLFDHTTFSLGTIIISRGWLNFLSIIIKCVLTVTAGFLLVATTGMDKLAAALRMLKVPKIFVLQLLLTYRYIGVLIEEAAGMMRAYSLRAPGQKGLHPRVWGSFLGQLLLRTFDRAQRVYQAMSLRGFSGEYHTGGSVKIGYKDVAYFVVWIAFFIIVRIYNIPVLLGSLFT